MRKQECMHAKIKMFGVGWIGAGVAEHECISQSTPREIGFLWWITWYIRKSGYYKSWEAISHCLPVLHMQYLALQAHSSSKSCQTPEILLSNPCVCLRLTQIPLQSVQNWMRTSDAQGGMSRKGKSWFGRHLPVFANILHENLSLYHNIYSTGFPLIISFWGYQTWQNSIR